MPISRGYQQDSESDVTSWPHKPLNRPRSKLEEVTSELSNLKEVIRSNAAPHSFHTDNSRRSISQHSLSPEGGFLVPPIVNQRGRSSFDVSSLGFYEIEDFRNSAFYLGEQRLGDVQLTGTAIGDLFEQYGTSMILTPGIRLTTAQLPATLLSARSGFGYFFVVE